MTKHPNPNSDLLAEIARHCETCGISETAFGKKALGDPSFVATLKKGRDLRQSTLAKIRAALDRDPRPAASDEAAA